MKKKLPANIEFRIPPKLKWGFLLLIALYLFWALKPFSKFELSQERLEMEPLVSAGTSLYLYQRPSLHDYLPGDIILFSTKEGPLRLAWVAGTAHDTFKLKGNSLSSQNINLSLKGVPDDVERTYPQVPAEHLFLVHRDQTLSLDDSLTQGPYSFESLNVLGKLFFHFPKEEKPISTEIDSTKPSSR